MSMWHSDAEVPSTPTQTQSPGNPPSHPAQYAQNYPVQPPTQRPLRQRPVAVVLIIAGGLVTVAFVLFVVLPTLFSFFSSVRPLSKVMLDDFAVVGDAPMTVYEGVALMCGSGGTMFLADAATGDPLPASSSDFPCQESMSMSLEVRDSLVNWGPNAANHRLYVGNEVYTGLDSVGVVVSSTQPDQVLRVSKIEAYQ